MVLNSKDIKKLVTMMTRVVYAQSSDANGVIHKSIYYIPRDAHASKKAMTILQKYNLDAQQQKSSLTRGLFPIIRMPINTTTNEVFLELNTAQKERIAQGFTNGAATVKKNALRAMWDKIQNLVGKGVDNQH